MTISFNLLHKILRGIESYAFEKSINETKVSFFMAVHVSIIDVTVDKWSRVLLDFLYPFCSSCKILLSVTHVSSLIFSTPQ